MSNEIKDCPFCGSNAISDGEVLTTDIAGETVTQSMCEGCGALGPGAALGPGEVDYGDVKAREAWNRRSALASREAAPVVALSDVTKLTRYEMTVEYNKYACEDVVVDTPSLDGLWVKYSDVAILAAQQPQE